MSASKIASKHDCNYAINQGNSNETSVKLSKEFVPLFDLPDPDEKEYNVTLLIFKDELCKMLAYIVSNLPLYDKKGELVYFNSSAYVAKLAEIQNFFGDEESAEYKVSLMNRKDRSLCIQGFPKGLNIRDFMVEDATVISMDKIDKTIECHICPRYRAMENKIYNKHDLSQILKYDSIQQIYYGAPGTGKSHKIKRQTAGMSVIRTTFHPDSDYSTFVGAYKPTMNKENKIVYTFVKQAFLKAYLKAWQKYSESGNEVEAERQYLIIEEINRGNCAQIFGDLFQLLDRSKNGFSEYPIESDEDMRKAIAHAFANENDFKLVNDINLDSFFPNYNSNYGSTISNDIQQGRVLVLPPNLYIWATMNTSDQSLFPIDSAFKRRWDWEYVPIQYANENWVIDIKGAKYSWVSFQKIVNQKIYDINHSEDKMLGDFFVKAENDVITEKVLLNKILFYLWNDVCKDGEGDIFKKDAKTNLTFSDLYSSKGTENLIAMMKYLGVEDINANNANENNTTNGGSDPKYIINGVEKINSARQTVKRTIIKYIEEHPAISVDELQELWNEETGRPLLETTYTQSPSDSRTRRDEITWDNNTKSVWVWMDWSGEAMKPFIEKAKRNGITIDIVN